jgi:hypothetical protein
LAPGPTRFVADSIQRARSIRAQVVRVRTALPQVQDRTPEWMRLARTIATVAGIVAMIGGAVYFGVGPIIRRGLAWVGVLIPAPTVNQARLDAETVNQGVPLPEAQVRRIESAKATTPGYARVFKATVKPEIPA